MPPGLQKHDPGVEVGIETWVELAHYEEHPSYSNTTICSISFKENSP